MSRAEQILVEGAGEILGRELTELECATFQKYLEMIVKWQRVHRLVGSVEPDWITRELFLDSLLFLRVLPPGLRSIADLGSGAGLPGIPIKIVRPEADVTLIESRERRASFLAAAVRELRLPGIQVLNARAEQLAADAQPRFGAVVMRCAGDSARFLPLASRLLEPGGIVIATGPPRRHELPMGRWVEVDAVGRSRRFIVAP